MPPANHVVLARQAMATRFEIVLHGDNPVSLRAAAEEALEEVEKLERQLSLYRPGTEIARVNARAYHEPVRVSPPVFRLLQRARQLHDETGGAFDITIAPLMRCWGLMGGKGRVPSPDELATVRARVGMQLVRLCEENFTVQFEREGVMLDLGAIGKGYAVEKAADILRELGVSSALIHGGTSTIYAIGRPPDQEAWKVAIELPFAVSTSAPHPVFGRPFLPDEARNSQDVNSSPNAEPKTDSSSPTPLAVVALRDESLSVSAVWGKSFASGGVTFGHIIDPRSGEPGRQAILAAVILPSATETDALSTALLTAGSYAQAPFTDRRPALRSLLVRKVEGGFTCDGRGIQPLL